MFIEQIFGTPRPSYNVLKDFLDSNKEDARVEFKRSVSENIYKNLIREVVAFANSEGGVLIIGVTDSMRQIVGCEENSDNIEQHILGKIEPSMAGLFVIETVETPENKHVIIVEVENSPEMHAVKPKKNKKKEPFEGYAYYYRRYTYYYRNAMSVSLMTPSVLNRISSIKKDLRYNYNFRIKIFLEVNEILSKLLHGINSEGKNNMRIEGLASLSRDYLSHFRSEEVSINSEIVKIIRSLKLKFLYQGMWDDVVQLYVNILETERDIPHTVLAFEEETSLRKLKNILNVGLNINSNEANIDLVSNLQYISLKNEVFYNQNLNLLSAGGLFAYALEFLTTQRYREDDGPAKLSCFDKFLTGKENYNSQGSENGEEKWLTIDDLEKVMTEFFKMEPGGDYSGFFEKINRRKDLYLYNSTKTFTSMILKLINLRDYIYENLSLPLDRNTLKEDYKSYLKNSKTSFVYPDLKDL